MQNHRTIGQHLLPQFLQRQFACRKIRGESYVYYYRRGVGLVSERGVNTKNVGKVRLFYGETADTGIETSISLAESKFAECLQTISKSGAVDCSESRTIGAMVANLSIRTKYLRDGLADIGDKLLGSLITYFAEKEQTLAAQELLRNHPEAIRNGFADLLRTDPSVSTDPAIRVAISQRMEQLLIKNISQLLKASGTDFQELFTSLGTFLNFDDIARRAHLKVMKTNVAPDIQADLYAGLAWCVMQTDRDLVLGDCGPMGGNDSGEIRPVFAIVNQLRAVYLPIAPRLLLVGTVEHEERGVDSSALNQATVENSRDFFIAPGPDQNTLVEHIGVKKDLVNDKYMEEVTASAITNSSSHDSSVGPADFLDTSIKIADADYSNRLREDITDLISELQLCEFPPLGKVRIIVCIQPFDEIEESLTTFARAGDLVETGSLAATYCRGGGVWRTDASSADLMVALDIGYFDQDSPMARVRQFHLLAYEIYSLALSARTHHTPSNRYENGFGRDLAAQSAALRNTTLATKLGNDLVGRVAELSLKDGTKIHTSETVLPMLLPALEQSLNTLSSAQQRLLSIDEHEPDAWSVVDRLIRAAADTLRILCLALFHSGEIDKTEEVYSRVVSSVSSHDLWTPD